MEPPSNKSSSWLQFNLFFLQTFATTVGVSTLVHRLLLALLTTHDTLLTRVTTVVDVCASLVLLSSRYYSLDTKNTMTTHNNSHIWMYVPTHSPLHGGGGWKLVSNSHLRLGQLSFTPCQDRVSLECYITLTFIKSRHSCLSLFLSTDVPLRYHVSFND